MSRHRNVRSMNYSDEYDGYDDVYGHSVEDDYTISPSDAAFMYDRNHPPQMSAFLAEEDDIAEEDETALDGDEQGTVRRDSETYQRPQLSDIDEARLLSCIEEIRNVIGDTISEQALVETILKHDFNLNQSLDAILSSAASSAQAEDPNSKRPREKKDTGKDKDGNPDQLRSIIHTSNIAFLRKDIAKLTIEPPLSLPNAPQECCVDSQLKTEFAKSLIPGPNNKISIPRFKFKTNARRLTEDSSDEDEEGSLMSLIAKHQKNAPTASKQFSSLTELANQHLKSNPPVLKQPLRSVLQPIGSNTFPSKPGSFHMNTDENEFMIDLSCALKSSARRPINTGVKEKEYLEFKTDFIDDSVLKSTVQTPESMKSFDFALNATNIRNVKVPRRKKLSSFGKVVCRKWLKRVQTPDRPQETDVLHEIPIFDFLSPSPDDLVKQHLKRK